MITVWKIGFRLWSAWQHLRLAAPGVVLAALVLLAQGPSLLFWLLVLGTLAVICGARAVLGDLARREGVTAGKQGKR